MLGDHYQRLYGIRCTKAISHYCMRPATDDCVDVKDFHVAFKVFEVKFATSSTYHQGQ